MSNIQKTRTQHLRGTASQWAQLGDKFIPLEGEIVIEMDEENDLHKLKIGDGIHMYSELAYLMAGDEIVTQVLTQTKPRIITVTLNADAWVQITDENNPKFGHYYQVLTIENITTQSRLDLQPDLGVIDEFKKLKLIFSTENNNGVISVFSTGSIPGKNYTMQATIVETNIEDTSDVIVGMPIITSAAVVVDQEYSPDSENAQSGKAVEEALDQFANNLKTINNQSLIGSGNILISSEGSVTIDQTYNPESENAQSGKAVAQALEQFTPSINEDQLVGKKTSEGGEIFNDYENNKALATNSISAGNDTQAGYKGYKITHYEFPEDNTYVTIWLNDKDLEDKVSNVYQVNDQIHMGPHFHDRYYIYSIGETGSANDGGTIITLKPTYGDVITDDFKKSPSEVEEDFPDGSRNWLYVIGKPYGEPIKHSKGATSLGSGTLTTGGGALATGILTQALGLGSFTSGSDTRAGYCAVASGTETEAMYDRSVALNYLTKTGRNNQTVVGKANEVEKTAMFVVGGGTGGAESLRKTIFKVEDNGDIYGIRDLTIDGEITTKGKNLTDDLNEINYQLYSPERYTFVDYLPKDTTNYSNMYLVKNPEATLGFDKFLYNDTGERIIEASAIWDGTLVAPTINEDGAYVIDTAEKLAYVISNGGIIGEETGCHFIITKDIYLNDVTKVNWATGKAVSGYKAKKWYSNNTEAGQKINVAFNGTIDGGYHTIHGIYIPYAYTFSAIESKNCAGLIPYIDENSDVTIKNLSIDNAFMKTRGHVGAIVGQTRGPIKIDNCSVGANVYLGASSAGAIRGGGYANSSSAIITNCYSLANLNLTDSNGNLPIEKGVCGHFWDKSVEITSCFNANGPICSVDYKKTRIKDSYATEEVVVLEGVTINSIENMQGLDVLTNPNKMPLLEKLHQFKATEGYPTYKFATFDWIKIDDGVTKTYVDKVIQDAEISLRHEVLNVTNAIPNIVVSSEEPIDAPEGTIWFQMI